MFDFIGVLILLLLLAIFTWLTLRAWRARQVLVKWTASILAGLVTCIAAIAIIAVLLGFWKLNKKYDNPVKQISVDATPERVARGARFEPICSACHAPDSNASLTGNDFMGEEAPPIGNLYAPNLTPVHLAKWTDGEIIRAVREGIHRSGRSLLIMPSDFFHSLGDEDVESIVAYLRSLPAEGSETPPTKLNVIGALLSLQAPIFQAQSPVTEPVISPLPGPTVDYGRYISEFTCDHCHGSDLLGDPEIKAPALIAISSAWSEDEFINFMRTGNRPNGTQVNAESMPWEILSELFNEDDEIRAMYQYLEEMGAAYMPIE